ncbi:cysteine desulfurase family protein [Leadbettera azotonutricia]|uniref:cysteine desulfurase n=1 Tax=Leadbettera azotonutricia (strain ATCC BAA-888 / DSM 13862 / ZAS-9) TaxID=545695 RepID=F5YE72_LEAAZ|nr:cysteine desulfurase family protein [Leadbettera azotonutricia]AEF81345.1 cysteine desulfurase [Leadbettera azotonutricia ZAS-9]
MTERKIYIDYNATTPLREEVKAAIIEDLGIYGNASSMHASGRLAHARVEEARQAVGALLGAPAAGIIFTSGGSESNNTVFQTMRSIAGDSGRNEFITTAIEHPCVLNSASYLKKLGFKVTFLPVDDYGKIKMDAYKAALSDKTLLVSVMMANNEIGTIQDIKEISRLAKEKGAWVHSDVVQAVGKIPVNAVDLGVDYLTVSCHKIYGPKGIGALYVKKGAPLFPLIHGGHQEDGFRAGTYNNIGILGFGIAAVLARRDLDKYARQTRALRNKLRDGLLARVPNIKINGHPEDVLPNTLNVSFPRAEGEAILLSMDIKGIEASTGSACASGSLEPSHVLMALGVDAELAHGSIRFSLGWGTSDEDIDYIIEEVPPIIARLRAMSTLT